MTQEQLADALGMKKTLSPEWSGANGRYAGD